MAGTFKAINERFTPSEYEQLLEAKGKTTWHDFILDKCLTKNKKKPDMFDIELGDTNPKW